MPPVNQPVNQPTAPNGAVPAGTPPAPTADAEAKTPKNANSTQNSLLLSEVRDNMVIMADGSFRAVIVCKSINFDLMSQREREGVEYSYQNFLNALTHPIQILIRSQRIDIGPYIDKLLAIRRSQDNMLLNVLMDDYIEFIDILSQEANIMDKSFYITVPYYPNGEAGNIIEQGKGFFGKLFAPAKNAIVTIDEATYEKAKTEIKNRVDGVMAGLFQAGIQCAQLDSKELMELYYNFYVPDTAAREPLVDFNKMATTFVRKGEGIAPTSQNGGAI